MSRLKILYMELLNNNYGNKRLDLNIIKCLTNFTDVTVACPKGWLSVNDGARLIEFDQIEVDCSKKNKILKHFYDVKMSCKKLKVAYQLDKQEHFDYLFFASFHIIALPLYLKKFPDFSKRVFITHHDSVDRIFNHALYGKIFNLYKNSVNHVVLEKFIGDFLIDRMNVKRERVFCVPHPLNCTEEKKQMIYDCVGISNSNDEVIIREIVEYEIKTKIFEKKQMNIILRSKNIQYDDGFLKVISGYLNDDEYYNYVASAKSLLVPFPLTFRYRMSGTVVDAFSNNIRVIGSKIPLLEYYEEQYPDICSVYETAAELIQILEKTKSKAKLELEFNEFKEKHNNEYIEICLKNMFTEKV